MGSRVPISDLIDSGALVINDGYRAKNSELSVQGVPFARAQNIGSGGFHFDDAVFFPQQELHRVGIKVSEPGDVVFTSKGTVGRFAFVRNDTPRFVYSPQLCFWRSLDHAVIHPRWLYYWMCSREFYVQYSGVAGQTDMAEYVSLRDQRGMYITLPSTTEQKAIACILGALDDKIEVNRRTNQTANRIIQSLFKSWFVDFDPVRKKAESRQAAGDLNPDLASLFPDAFSESSLGPIPFGWTVQRISDITEINKRTLSRNDTLDVIDYVEISAVMKGEISEIARYQRGEEPSRARRRLAHGDTVISTVRPDRGAYFLCLNPSPSLIASTGFAVISPKEGIWAFVHSALTQPEVGQELGRLADGGAYPAIRPHVIGDLPLVMPRDQRIVRVFERIVQPLYEKAYRNRAVSQTLAELRDTLLPRLISGELKIRDADRIIGRAL